MPKWFTELLRQMPFKKLNHHDVTNLLFDFIALGYTAFFTRHVTNELLSVSTWLLVIIMSLVCFFWASKL